MNQRPNNRRAQQFALFKSEMKMTREEIINKIVKLWNEKKTSGEIAKEMNLTRNAVMGVVHRHGKRKTPLKIIRRVEYKPKAEKPKIEKPKNEKKLEEKLTIFKKQIKVSLKISLIKKNYFTIL